MAKEFIYPYNYYPNTILFLLSLSLSRPLLMFTMKLECVIELKGFVCIMCVYVGVVLCPYLLLYAMRRDLILMGKKEELEVVKFDTVVFSIILIPIKSIYL